MNSIYELSVEVSEHYDFNKEALSQIGQNIWVKNLWPIVYFIQNPVNKVAYVGESTNAYSRIINHLSNSEKSKLKTISIIGSDKFNKSATLDIESKLIQYISAEETYQLLNKAPGVSHNYYQQDLYGDLFKVIWAKLIEKKIVSKSLEEIENSELFKYSPYKSLNEDQYNSVMEILEALSNKDNNTIFVHGSAGTGKTIVATYLIKLLVSNPEYTDDENLSENEIQEINLLQEIRKRYPRLKIGLVIAMSALRKSLKNVFKKIPGLEAAMVIGPSGTFKHKYDLLIVDEAHRLRRYNNIGWRGEFKKKNRKLGLDDTGTELDWILTNSKSQIFFYDEAQSVKPSDVENINFQKIITSKKTKKISLTSQMRVKGGNNYISFVDKLLKLKLERNHVYNDANYDLLFFDHLPDLYEKLTIKEEELGLCRMIAGYSWPWLSEVTPDAIDIKIDGLEFRWNDKKRFKDWVNSPNAFKEIGCIHTIQGYDLNYTGLIFGKEIDYDHGQKKIIIDRKKYFDKYGNQGASEIELHNFIINIYKTIMFRGIRGTYVYACNKNLGDYLKKHISSFKKGYQPRIIPIEKVKKYVNAVPLHDIKIAAGNFSELQNSEETQWVELPSNVMVKEGYFVCQVVGNSMNKRIPDGSWCLFKEYEGGSRNGEIVLAEHHSFNDSNFGAGYTIKEYHSKKVANENAEWQHESIVLKPLSDDPSFKDLILSEDDLEEFKIIGIFVCVLSE